MLIAEERMAVRRSSDSAFAFKLDIDGAPVRAHYKTYTAFDDITDLLFRKPSFYIHVSHRLRRVFVLTRKGRLLKK